MYVSYHDILRPEVANDSIDFHGVDLLTHSLHTVAEDRGLTAEGAVAEVSS